MGRNGCADIRDGDLFHGRYRILRSIEDDGAGVLYEAVDMVNNAHRIVKVVRAETLAGAGIRVGLRSDAPLWDSGNVAFLSDAGVDHDTRSFFLIMDLAEDSEPEPITRQRVIHLGESEPFEKAAGPSRSVTSPAIAPAGQPMVRRALVPLPLPPPLPPSPSRVSLLALPPPLPQPVLPCGTDTAAIGPLPPPTPPPEKKLPEAAPLSNKRMFSAKHFFALVAVAIGVGSVVYFHANPEASENAPEITPIPTARAIPDAVPIAAALGSQEVPDASVPLDSIPSETVSTKSEKAALDAAVPKASSNTSQPKSTIPQTSKQEPTPPTAAPPIAPVSTKRQRESIF